MVQEKQNKLIEWGQADIIPFIIGNEMKTENGKTLDFHTHRYLFDIYRDNSPYLCCIKAGQIGFSTMAIIKTIWIAKYKKLNIIYILPTVEMMQKFVGSKVNPVSQQNNIISSFMKDKDSVSQKQVGENFINYVGAQTSLSAIMLSADMIVSDEHDKSPQNILEIFDSRLQHSEYGWKWVFSNPTIPDFGVDRYWKMSDQKKWHIKHLGCGEIYVFDEDCIDYKQEKYICPKCKGEISREDIRRGEWVATAEGKWSGYWIPLWINPQMTADKIAEKKRNNTKEYFANFVAGLPYINTTDALSQSIMESNLVDRVNTQEGRIIIGVDTGHNIHYTLANKDGIFYHGYCDSVAENPTPGYDPYNELEALLTRYPRSIMVADQGGDLIGIRKLQAKYKGRVHLCWFTKETKNQEIIRWVDEEAGVTVNKVLVDRNRMVQSVVDEWKEQRFLIYGKLEDWQPFFTHCLNIYRTREIQGQDENDPQYGWRWIWKRKGPDHWLMSTVYARVGLDRYAQDLAQVIHKGNIMAGVQRAGNFTITEQPTNPMGHYKEIDF